MDIKITNNEIEILLNKNNGNNIWLFKADGKYNFKTPMYSSDYLKLF